MGFKGKVSVLRRKDIIWNGMKKNYLIILIFFGLIYILPLGVRPLVTPDETRYAEIPREMMKSGDWTVPRFNGFRYFEKPVMNHWLNGISMLIFGENEFAVRLPSALAAGFLALLLFVFVNSFTRNNLWAFYSSAIFLSFLEVFFVGVFSVTDSLLSLFLCAALIFFFYACREKQYPVKAFYLFIFGVCCGLAFLMKGFLAFAVPVIVIVPFMIWEKRFKELFTLAWIPMAAALLVSLPWCVTVHLREKSFWDYFFWVEHIGRFTSSGSGQHPQPVWFFIPVILAGALPWTIIAPSIISGLGRDIFKTPFTRYAVCWLLFPLLFFSASSGKLATYILPCFPPLAILTASGILNYLDRNSNTKSFNFSVKLLASLMGLAAIALIVSQFSGIELIRLYGKGENSKFILAFSGLALWAIILRMSLKQDFFRKKLALFCIAPLPLMFFFNFIVPGKVLDKKAPGALLTRNIKNIAPDSVIVAYPSVAGAASWYLKRDDIYLLHKPGEFEHGLSYPDSKHRILSIEDFREVVEKGTFGENLILIMEHRDKREMLPPGKFEDSVGEYFFIKY